MDKHEIMIELIEIYGRQLSSQGWLHKTFHNCKLCNELKCRKQNLIDKLEKACNK